ncbi:sensor histidine kinase [Mucilaginibacter celer]|uniref:histidine kinase n=1 Tax=Mucilaginibacter celer TaxID=2305508 RepID=A0A494VVN3_9SPHI|nr:sensor histidine kinase [Mucilaginibacter celer]AYL99646.1 sensor histidine kinase [Mucilaginibacter celer]
MTFKSFHPARQFIWGLLCFILCICFTNSRAQTNLSGYNDVTRQRLLVTIAGQYLHTISQGQIDADSAMRISAKIYGLSPLLIYNEWYSDGKPTAGSNLLDAGKVKEARALLERLTGDDRLRLLADLSCYFIFKPGNAKADLDEASVYINEGWRIIKPGAVNWEIAYTTLRAHWLNQSGRDDESQKAFAYVVALSEKTGNMRAKAQAMLSAAELLHYGDPARVAMFQKALSIFTSLNLKDKQIEALSEINIDYFVEKHYDIAEKYMLEIVKLQSAIKFRYQQFPYDALAFIAIRKGDLTSALTYSTKSLQSMVTKADSAFKSFFWGRRAVLYSKLLKYDDAIELFNKILENKSTQTRLFWYKAFLAQSETLLFVGREKEALRLLTKTGAEYRPATLFEKMFYTYLLGRAYETLHQNSLAEKSYQAFLEMAEKFPPEYIQDEYPRAFIQIANFYRTLGQNSGARKLLELARRATPKLDMEWAGVYHYNLFKLDSADKNYLRAFKELQLSQQYSDSAFSYDQRKKTAELLLKYETEKKDKNIKLLNSQNQLERIKAQEANRTKNKTLIGIVLLIIIIGLLFNRYRIKQKNNLQLEANQKELDQKNAYLETLNTEQDKLLKEKEWLLKEVHHRVKNNLQMVTSLLYSQSVYLEDNAAKVAVNDSLRRMQAMALIHQKLYQDQNTTTIAMPEYINDLVQYLHESFDAGNRISFEQQIEALDLDVSQAIPLGLIVTESIVNAMKYAFLNEEDGTVSIILQHDSPDYLVLKISDNGIGLPPGFDTMEHNSLGLDLMQGLARQLKGYFNIETDNGVHITVRFLALTLNK